jgi:hypothetical protein
MLVFRRLHHASGERLREIGVATLKEHSDIAHGFGIGVGSSKSGDAGAEASFDVVLQTGTCVIAIEIHGARRNEKVPVDEIGDAVSQRSREVGSKVERTVFAKTSGDVDAGIALGDGELYIRIAFVVAKKDVVARLLLLNEVVFERESLALVVDDDVLDVDGLAEEGASLGVGHGGFNEIGAYPGAEALGLADINDLTLGVLI